MITKTYKCDLCHEEQRPEDGNSFSLKWTSQSERFKLCSLFGSEASEDILCKKCIDAIKEIK